MNFGEIKTLVRDLVARTDYTDTKVGEHINLAINRLSRVQGLPNMEKAVDVTLTAYGAVDIPSDFINIVHLIFGTEELQKIPYPRLLKVTQQGPQPYYYARMRNQFDVRPYAEGTMGLLIYVAAWPNLVNASDTNEILVSGYEAVAYAAASYAATYFQDSRLEEFESRYQALSTEMAAQAERAEMSSPTGLTLLTPYDGLDY
jgi:hypothetical protein